MKIKRLKHIVVMTLMVLCFALSVVWFAANKSCSDPVETPPQTDPVIKPEPNPDDSVTITFDTNGGSKVDPIIVEKGTKLSSLPQSFLAGKSFDYWYTDEGLQNEFKLDTVINNDMTLYAGFNKTNVDVNVTETTNYYIEKVEANHSIKIVVDKSYSKKEFIDAIKITAVSGYLPWNEPDELDESLPKEIYDWYDISQDGLVYTLTPKALSYSGRTVYAYTAGQKYQVTIPSKMYFDGLETSIKEYTFRIADADKSTSVDNVKYKDNLIFVKKSDITNINAITEISAETKKKTIVQDTNGYYNLYFDKAELNENKIEKNKILCIGDGVQLDTNSLFVKVVDVIEKLGNGKIEYLVLAVDADIEEVFDKIDVNYNEPISSDDILANLDLEEIKEEIKTNGSLDKVTTLMNGLVLVSDEVQEAYALDEAEKQQLEGTNPGLGLPDFCYNTEIRNEATLFKFKPLDDAEVKITAGKGHNPNFDKAYTDEFVALRITFEYEATIKNKLEIQASITFTQYLAASAQGYLDYDWGVFKLKWAEFDFAVNLYSQTDIDFKILVRTVKENGTDKGNDNNNNDNGDDKKEKFKDISEKIAEKLKSDEGDEPDNLVAELREMLDAEDTEIELFRAPILNIPIKIIPILPVMEVNVELDFLVKMKFAAGFSSHISVLEAVQVGVTGSTKDKSIKSYKHDNLIGGNQYALQLSACGYIGFKAGFEGGISVSFCGLSSLGRVGIWVYTGAYVDIYGFAQATLVKQNGLISQSLVGGYYIEIGIFLDVSLEARSKLFGTSIGTKLVEEKWPLVSFGNKEVLVSVENKALEETVYIANNGENEASIKLDNLPKLTGTYIDITTGETYSKEVPWSKVTLKTSLNKFKYNPASQTIDYGNYDTFRPVSETCIATYYFNGPILQFNMSSTKYKDLCPFASTKIIYYDSTKIDQSQTGKEVSVKFYSLVNGEKTLLEERKVLTGSYIYSSDAITLDVCKYVNITWDRIPWDTVVTEDTEFICSAELRQAYVAFVYYDVNKDAWITEIRVANLGEKPIAPTVQNSDKITFTNWRGRNGLNNKMLNTPADQIGEVISVADFHDRGFFLQTTFGKDLNTPLVSYESKGYTNYDYTDQLTDQNHINQDGYIWYYVVSSIYIANYQNEQCKVTIYHDTDSEENEKIEEYSIDYNTTPNKYTTYGLFSMDFLGFAEEKDGKVVYETIFEVGNITKDIVLYAKYKKITHKAKLYYYDVSTHDYKLYKTIDIDGGVKFGDIRDKLDCIADEELVKEEGVKATFLRFVEFKGEDITYLYDTTLCTRDLDIYPVFSREVDVIFDAGEGHFPYINSSGEFVKQEKIYTESKLNYKLELLPLFCVNDFKDLKYCYEFVGWKNSVTGEEIRPENPKTDNIDVITDVPTTFTAIYEPVERTDYHVHISTEYNTLKDGTSKELIENNITYDEYQRIKEEYNIWIPENYRDEANKCTYVPYHNVREENNTFTLTYMFNPQYDRVRIVINPNGGVNNGSTMYDNVPVKDEIDLSTISITRVDEYGTWKMTHWTDLAGNEYKVDDKYVIRGNDTLTVHWEILTYIDYKITFILDGQVIDTKLYHKDDQLEAFTKPAQAEGKVFSGWTWYDSTGLRMSEIPTQMPSQNLTLTGVTSKVYITYILDEREISKVEGKVGYEETVREAYVKEGYTVTSWSTSDVEIENGKFVMPEKNVTFNATSTINSYTITYYHNDVVYGDIQTVNYGEYVYLQQLPLEEGMFYAWTSEDVNLGEFGFTMPAQNVVIRTMSSDVQHYILYYVNGELIDFKLAIPNKEVELKGVPLDFKYSGMEFSGWYMGNESLNGQSTFIMPNGPTYIYGYFTKGTTKVNIYFDETNETPDIVMYGSVNDTINISMLLQDQEIAGYKVNNVVVDEILITGTSDINAYVQYATKKYSVRYIEEGYTLPAEQLYTPGEKVLLTELPLSDEYTSVDGWFSGEVEILTDEDGKLYFIMPEKDVIINVKHHSKYESSVDYLTASTYITLPDNSEPVLYQQYKIYNDSNLTYFTYPVIEGYEFVGFKDVSGEIVAHDFLGIRYDDMNGDNRSFYAEYRKLVLRVASFRLNNEYVYYHEFYDAYEVRIPAPVISLEEGKEFTGWQNLLVSPALVDNTLVFYTGKENTYEYANMDLTFVGFTYQTEDSYATTIEYEDGIYELYVNDYSELVLERYHNQSEVKYVLYVNYTVNDGESTEMLVKNAVTLNNGEFIVSIPNMYEFTEQLKVNETDTVTIDYFTIKSSIVQYDYVIEE